MSGVKFFQSSDNLPWNVTYDFMLLEVIYARGLIEKWSLMEKNT